MEATKIVMEQRLFSCEERLREQGLWSLEKRQHCKRKGDLITSRIFKEVIQ